MPTVLITGGHKGLGLAATKRIAARGGCDLLLAGRSIPEIEAVANSLRGDHAVNARAIELDVSSLDSVRRAVATIESMVEAHEVAPLQALLCNAGVQFLRGDHTSVDGYEQTFATNCLGHFLLINLLLDRLEPNGRIVFTASGTHDPETMDGKSVGAVVEPDAMKLAYDGKSGARISGGKRYTTSKLCTMLYSYELDRRLKANGSGIASIAFDPGLIVETGLSRSVPAVAQKALRSGVAKWMFKRIGVTMGSLSFSGDALAGIAVDPAYADAGGTYLQSSDGRLIERRSSKKSYDVEAARRLWAESEQLVHLTPAERPERLHGNG